MMLTVIQKCILSYMLSLVELYQRVNDLDKIDENGFVAAQNRKELFANIKFEEDSIRKVWGVDQRQLNALLYKLKIQCLDYDPWIVDAEKLFSRIDSQRIFLRNLDPINVKDWNSIICNIRNMR